jgi:hypothetical protein
MADLPLPAAGYQPPPSLPGHVAVDQRDFGCVFRPAGSMTAPNLPDDQHQDRRTTLRLAILLLLQRSGHPISAVITTPSVNNVWQFKASRGTERQPHIGMVAPADPVDQYRP